jgi:serine protease Do
MFKEITMSSLKRSPSRQLAAAAAVVVGLAAGVYALIPGQLVTAQSSTGSGGTAAKPPPAVALNQANALSEAFRNSADQVLPAVVSIKNESQPKLVKRELRAPRGKGPNTPGLPKEFGDLDPLLKRFFDQIPGGEDAFEFDGKMPGRQSSGSGVIIDPAGVILTNNHVVAGDGKITVKLHDGREFVAEKALADPSTDIAVVRIKASGSLPSAKLGDSDSLRIGDWVLAVGQPFGLTDSVTAGIVSAKGRDIGMMKHEEFIQTDAAINPGNSGGPLVNLQGEVVGVNTAISSSTGHFEGVGFAVPVNVAKWVSSQLLKDGKVKRAYLGIGIQPVSQDLAEQFNLNAPSGAIVTEVQPGSPAAAAGVQQQDVILEFGGSPISSVRQLQAKTARSSIGSKVPLVVQRNGKRVELTVTLKEQPANYGETVTKPASAEENSQPAGNYDQLGVTVEPLTGDVAKQLGVTANNGVVITAVQDGSPADRAGLAPGMAIMQVGKQTVKSVAEFETAVKSASLDKGVLVLVRSAEGAQFKVLKKE